MVKQNISSLTHNFAKHFNNTYLDRKSNARADKNESGIASFRLIVCELAPLIVCAAGRAFFRPREDLRQIGGAFAGVLALIISSRPLADLPWAKKNSYRRADYDGMRTGYSSRVRDKKQISCWKCKGYILLWLTLLVLHTQAAQEWCEFEILLLSWAFLLGQPHQPPFERRNRNGLWRPITQVKICNLRL